jgi:microcystin-dependent protein
MTNFLFPLGSIVAYAAQIDPVTSISGPYNFSATPQNNTGWLVCNGAPVAQEIFPDLYAVLGNIYGEGADVFNLPDYQGYFLRGLAVNAGQDPGLYNRTASAGGDNIGVGSTQACMVQQHQHSYNQIQESTVPGGNGGPASLCNLMQTYTSGLYTDSNGSSALSGEETRPTNVYVNYLIFAGQPASVPVNS